MDETSSSSHKSVIVFVLCLVVGLVSSYFFQINSNFHHPSEYAGRYCLSSEPVHGIKYSFRSGFPFTFYERKVDVLLETQKECSAFLSDPANEAVELNKVHWGNLIADVVVVGVGVSVVLFVLYSLLGRGGGNIQFKWSWLIVALILSGVANFISYSMLALAVMPPLAIPVMWLLGPILESLSWQVTSASQLILLLVLPTLFYAFFLYMAIWGIAKMFGKG